MGVLLILSSHYSSPISQTQVDETAKNQRELQNTVVQPVVCSVQKTERRPKLKKKTKRKGEEDKQAWEENKGAKGTGSCGAQYRIVCAGFWLAFAIQYICPPEVPFLLFFQLSNTTLTCPGALPIVCNQTATTYKTCCARRSKNPNFILPKRHLMIMIGDFCCDLHVTTAKIGFKLAPTMVLYEGWKKYPLDSTTSSNNIFSCLKVSLRELSVVLM